MSINRWTQELRRWLGFSRREVHGVWLALAAMLVGLSFLGWQTVSGPPRPILEKEEASDPPPARKAKAPSPPGLSNKAATTPVSRDKVRCIRYPRPEER